MIFAGKEIAHALMKVSVKLKNEGVPVIFNTLQMSRFVSIYGSIKCDVVFFIQFSHFLSYFLSFIEEELGFKAFFISNISRGLSIQRGIIVKGKRCYSSSAPRSNSKINLNEGKQQGSQKKGSKRNLSSPEAKSYPDLYKGRGKPKSMPVWVKDNGMERSPFGASWAKSPKDRLHLPGKYPCNYKNIIDPFNNRQFIKDICKGNRVVYIWTYMPTGVCLVGSSSNSVDRVVSYFERTYLFLEKRRGVQFLADYGFEHIQLTIVYLEYNKYTARDVKIIEAYYINELNSSLNSQKFVYLPPEPLESALPFINITNRDTAVPIFVYGPDLTKVLYVFNSKTSFYSEFNVHWNTLVKYLDVADNKLYNYFTFSSKIFEGSDLDSLLSLNELIDLKTSVDPNIPRRGHKVKLIDLAQNIEYEFYSFSKAAAYILETVGSCDAATLRTHMKNSTIYKRR